MSSPNFRSLLLVGPVHQEAEGAAQDRSLLFGSAHGTRHQTAVKGVEFHPWPTAAGEPLDLPLLAWSLSEDDEPMELILAGLEAGRRLKSAGYGLLMGPSLDPQSWSGKYQDPELTAKASVLLLQGLSAAGLLLCGEGFPAASAEEIIDRWRAFPHAFAHGLDAVRLSQDAASPDHAEKSCRVLRQELGFAGVIAGRALSPEDVPRLLIAGCDLIQTADSAGALETLEDAQRSGILSPRRVGEAHQRVATFLD